MATPSHLNPSISVLEALSSEPSEGPSLIILSTWMDAHPKHIAKYTAGYRILFPSSRIVIVTTSALQAAVLSTASNISRIAPLLDLLYSLPAQEKVLLHSFSNGGAMTTVLIAKTYAEKMKRPLPIRALVLDSTPGKSTYAATIRAFSVGVPKALPFQVLANLVLPAVWVLYKLFYVVQGNGDLVDQLRSDLLESRFWGEKKRLYFFSERDEMVDWRAVDEHVMEAKEKGWEAVGEKFGESGHCAHAALDGERYWGAVGKLWKGVV